LPEIFKLVAVIFVAEIHDEETVSDVIFEFFKFPIVAILILATELDIDCDVKFVAVRF
jgi:hypothetical protein